jgi:hypothetical protein
MATAAQRAIKHQLAGHRHQGIDDLLLKYYGDRPEGWWNTKRKGGEER